MSDRGTPTGPAPVTSGAEADLVLDVRNLVVRTSDLTAVRGVDIQVRRGQRVGIVGESGAGKSLTALAVMGLLQPGWRTEGEVHHDGVDLTTISDRSFSGRRGRTLSMVFQDPLSALNPTKRVGAQITAVIRRHLKVSREEARAQALDLLAQMNLPRPEQMLRAYPHELSGGQRQRIMIAMAVACYPQLIIADEPTTALDVTVQKQVLRLLDHAVSERGSALLMITHDLPVIAAMCDHVVVMYGGRVIEEGPVDVVFRSPRHPYTRGLLDSQPTLDNIELEGTTRLPSIPGSVPPLHLMPTGCPFRTRCARADARCEVVPVLTGEDSRAACWHPERTDAMAVAR
ncbi:ATP-binding cassette domain-containing protein [Nocardioides sp. zg-579]|uniref:ATP-binding cassette domain-containing protein n=1 Tax=Nocardioides marmotae TaxID=2663857 RepID=A0A6I3J9R1_9ACTN|nr:ABC transporter ATP-binding protein [Nocardioides marmotae]MCR6030734.1 ATP-binding cassette domain-containing protein [Gordonia jinghuaiqii]MTB94368.1 ATP-binding cassette domain-containing protein [Nocardioides marmotae]QKE01606.1 ABC transporter ATP-binding protein [Nocardioides marmotae]